MSKRDEILTTALSLFSRYGYASVGVDKIIAESGVAKMTLYKQFGTKEGLIAEVLKLRDELFMADLCKYVNGHTRGVKRISAIFEWHRRWFKSKEFNGCMFIKASEEFNNSVPEFTAIMRNHKLSIQALIRNCLIEANSAEIEKKTAFIFICLEGLTVHANMFKPENLIDSVLETALAVVAA